MPALLAATTPGLVFKGSGWVLFLDGTVPLDSQWWIESRYPGRVVPETPNFGWLSVPNQKKVFFCGNRFFFSNYLIVFGLPGFVSKANSERLGKIRYYVGWTLHFHLGSLAARRDVVLVTRRVGGFWLVLVVPKLAQWFKSLGGVRKNMSPHGKKSTYGSKGWKKYVFQNIVEYT